MSAVVLSCAEDNFPLVLPTCWLIQSFHPLVPRGPLEEEACCPMSPSSPLMLTLPFDQLWGSALTTTHWTRKFLWWGLSCTNKDINLRAVYTLSIWQNNRRRLTPSLYSPQLWALGQIYSAKHMLPLVEYSHDFICLLVCLCAGVCVWRRYGRATVNVWRRTTFSRLFLSFHPVGPWDYNAAIRLGGKCPNLLCPLADPSLW